MTAIRRFTGGAAVWTSPTAVSSVHKHTATLRSATFGSGNVDFKAFGTVNCLPVTFPLNGAQNRLGVSESVSE